MDILNKIALFLVCVFLLVSCKRIIDIKVENKPSILVADSELNSDSLVQIKLSLTQNITDNSGQKNANDAVIEVFDKDSNILEVLNKLGNGYYRSSFLKPKPASQYLFRITNEAKEYWANERMPDTLKCNVQDTSRIVFQGQKNFFQIQLRIQDVFNVKNYYGLKLKRHYKSLLGMDTLVKEEWLDIESIELVLTENPITQFSKAFLLFNDKFFDGSNMTLKFGSGGLFKNTNQKTLKLELYVVSMSASAFNYNASLNEHLFYQNDPFSQPTLLRGNVSNAFGAVVGSYTRKFEIKFQ